ncbi:hypothetical protein ATO6_04840 [Oceanicola sp. 22II-s10i]|uniref:hypothetical protein n=1 Tax=Oceanicola sp. 22II-s10i TaxID=1317116 RepID=UPI000B5274BC|nr:hypothetical protein [Oceanicola sp. 22II-s10i]OWU86180.1 hypothetical protein ATO6_04840 [Oceanicola sp. 22II-s10i]
MPNPTHFTPAAALIATLGVAAHAATSEDPAPGDGVTAMCALRDDPEVCTCATEALQDEVTEEDFAAYDRIGADFTARREAGEPLEAAWDAALAPVADDMGLRPNKLQAQMNPVGRAHRTAIRGCKS